MMSDNFMAIANRRAVDERHHQASKVTIQGFYKGPFKWKMPRYF
jgi:hypothetical protein